MDVLSPMINQRKLIWKKVNNYHKTFDYCEDLISVIGMELQEIQVDNDANQEISKSPTKADHEKQSTSSEHEESTLTEQDTQQLPADQEIQDSQSAPTEIEDLNKDIEATLDDIKTWLKTPSSTNPEHNHI